MLIIKLEYLLETIKKVPCSWHLTASDDLAECQVKSSLQFQSGITCKDAIYGLNRLIWKLFVFDKNTWNYLIVFKQMLPVRFKLLC